MMHGVHCPRCGQQQNSAISKFCSKCGFLMTGLTEVVARGGLPVEMLEPGQAKCDSPKKKGVKQGALLMLSSLIVVPLLAILSATLGISPFLVAITAVVTFWGGFLRIVYALIFQPSNPALKDQGFVDSLKQNLGVSPTRSALPPANPVPVEQAFQPAPGNWRDTSDLEPASVTEATTRTLRQPYGN